jgi:hypothetical protein
MTKTEVMKTIDSGKIFSCRYVKQNGEVRYLRGRTGVRKYIGLDGKVHELKGVGMKYNPKQLGYRAVFDIDIREYRMVNTITILEFNRNKVGNFFIQSEIESI